MGKYFGTDGARGVAGTQITVSLAYKIGRYIGQYLNGHKNKILIARDTRISSKMLSDAISIGAASSGSDVFDLGVSTTPSISYLIRKHGYDYGVMISASHNPYYDNGIKVFNNQGEKLEAEIEEKIEVYIDGKDDLPLMSNEKIGKIVPSQNLVDEYIDFLVTKAETKIKKLNVFIDCSNGSASEIAPRVLDKLGLRYTVVANKPNGLNINEHCGSTKIENNKTAVKKGNYDIAFAFDGDADRCLALTSDGELVNGDSLIYLNAMYLKNQHLLKKDTVSVTVMSNLGLKKCFEKANIKINETDVGDKYVQADMKANGLSVGGEQSGHIIFLDDLNTGDGLLTMIHTLNVLAVEQKSLQELLKDFKNYPQSLKNVVVTNKDAVLSNLSFKNKIKEVEDSLNGNGRILVRPSGTEPVIRVMCEAQTQEECDRVTSTLVSFVEDLF